MCIKNDEFCIKKGALMHITDTDHAREDADVAICKTDGFSIQKGSVLH